jgi:hypothetical protein
MANDTELNWIEIPSFSPGIVDELNTAQGVVAYAPAPIGSAKTARGCIALPTGSLVPGWKIVQDYSETPSFSNNWTSPGYRPTAGKQMVCDTSMLTPVHQETFAVDSSQAEHGAMAVTGEPYDRPDHLFIGYGEAYNTANTGPAAAPFDRGNYYPTVYTLIGYLPLTSTTVHRFPAAFTQTDQPYPTFTTTRNAIVWGSFYARQGNKVGGSLAVGRGGTGIWDHTVPTNNQLAISALDNWKPFVVWSPMARRSPDVDWAVFPGNTGIVNATGVRNPPHDLTLNANETPTLWDMGSTQLTASVFHSNRLVWSSFDSSAQTTYGPFLGNFLASFAWTPGIEWSQRGGGGFIWKNTMGASPTDIYGIQGFATVGDEADQVAWMCSINGTTLMVMMVASGAYLIKGDLDALNIQRLAGVPGCYKPWTKPVQMATTVVWAAHNGIFTVAEDGQVTPLSSNLKGDFWVPHQAEDQLLDYAPIGKMNHRDPFLLAPNDYVYDKRTTSWWQLPRGYDPRDPADVAPLTHYEVGMAGHVYGVCQYRDATHHETFVVYDPSTQLDQASDIWFWQSNPIRELEASPGQSIDLRRVEFVASGHGTIQVQAFGLVNNVPAESMYASVDVDSDFPIRVEASLAYRTDVDPSAQFFAGVGDPGSTSVTISLTAFGVTNGATLPSIHPGFRLGYHMGPGLPLATPTPSPR